MALHIPTNFSVEKPHFGPAEAFIAYIKGPRSSLDTIVGVRAEGEWGIQRNAQDFRGSVQRGHLVADSDLWNLSAARTGEYPK